MIKYIPELTDIVLEEIPDRVTMAVEISNCRGSCIGCHSPFLKQDIGVELTPDAVDRLIADNFGVNCFLLLGEGKDPEALLRIAEHLRVHHPDLERAVYSGRPEVEPEIYAAFDYVKVGPYVAELGPLNERTTNQRLYHHGEDITFRFWHKGLDPNR
jgi:anaerobic ribonucleoside-triphosphate reductase activating protein